MPSSIHSPREDSEPVKTATLSSTSTSLTTISYDSIEVIEDWLDSVEKAEVTVLGAESGEAESRFTQELEGKGTRKRKYSSSTLDETSSALSLRQRSRHTLRLVTGCAMSMEPPTPTTGSGVGGDQVCRSPFNTHDCVANHRQGPVTPQRAYASDVPSTTSSKNKLSKDSGVIGRRLAMHRLYCDHKALGKYREFRDMVFEIVNGDQYSAMKPKSVGRVQHFSRLCEETNEATYLQNILPLIIKIDRTVKLEQDEPTGNSPEMNWDRDSVEPDPEPGDVYGSRDWSEDGIFAVMDQEFRKDILPHCYGDEWLARSMKKVDGMTTPRPDRCYGLEPDWIPGPKGVQLNAELQIFAEACPHISYPFFLVEGKSNNGSKIDAQNQARRGGAGLVNAARQLLAKIGELPVIDNGVDDRNFVFSATVYPGGMGIWVHWAELEDGLALFHMNLLKSIALDDPQQIPESRRVVNNIMCWGWDLKARRLTELNEKMYAWQVRETARLQEENRQKEAERKDGRKRLRSQ